MRKQSEAEYSFTLSNRDRARDRHTRREGRKGRSDKRREMKRGIRRIRKRSTT